jgi:hypothetical protein
MLAILAAVAALVGYLLTGTADHTTTWFSPGALGLAALALLALHLAGAGNWTRKP